MEDAGQTLSQWIDAAFGTASGATREELADAVAHLLARLHRRGIYHADLKTGNICWTPGARPRLIDYARVRFGRNVRRRRRIKNLAQVNASVPDLVPAEFRERTLQVYLEATQARAQAQPIRAQVVRESLRRHHRWSGC